MTIGAIEAGGTKFVCGLLQANSSDRARPQLIARASVPTTSPLETLEAALAFFTSSEYGHAKPDCFGIGCFGPVDLKPKSDTWGYITSTPKPLWSNTDIAGFFRSRLSLPVAFDTDVNAAAYGEFLWGAARELKDFVYITVGTGIGGGVFSGGDLVHGMIHPELGHLKLAREPGDGFAGSCPFHRDCLEGMASGPAIAARWGKRSEELPSGHPAWELEARYLARAIAAWTFTLSPERIIVGGGIGMREGMVERVAVLLKEELGGYVAALDSPPRLASYVVRPGLGAEAGLYGSAAIAMRFCAD